MFVVKKTIKTSNCTCYVSYRFSMIKIKFEIIHGLFFMIKTNK